MDCHLVHEANLADRGHAGQSLFRSVSGRCRVSTVDPCTPGPGDPATCGSGARRSGPVPGRDGAPARGTTAGARTTVVAAGSAAAPRWVIGRSLTGTPNATAALRRPRVPGSRVTARVRESRAGRWIRHSLDAVDLGGCGATRMHRRAVPASLSWFIDWVAWVHCCCGRCNRRLACLSRGAPLTLAGMVSSSNVSTGLLVGPGCVTSWTGSANVGWGQP